MSSAKLKTKGLKTSTSGFIQEIRDEEEHVSLRITLEDGMVLSNPNMCKDTGHSTTIICISGKALHGKDSVARVLSATLKQQGKKVLITHYADLLKYVREFFEWDGNKDNQGRQLLQMVGTDVVRSQCPDFWVNFVRDMLVFFDGEWDYVLIPDCRFPNEIEVLKKAGFNVLHLRVVRPGFDSPLSIVQQNHLSETALDSYWYDYQIKNGGTIRDLNEVVSLLAGDVLGEWK